MKFATYGGEGYMARLKVVAITALVTIGVVLLLEHPDILTAGASAHWVSSSINGEHLFVRSYALDVVFLLTLALCLVVAGISVRRRIKQREVWKRRYSMKSIDGGKALNSNDDLQDGEQ